MEKKYKVICKKCEEECEVLFENSGGCNDPECCGGASYYIEIVCKNCGNIY